MGGEGGEVAVAEGALAGGEVGGPGHGGGRRCGVGGSAGGSGEVWEDDGGDGVVVGDAEVDGGALGVRLQLRLDVRVPLYAIYSCHPKGFGGEGGSTNLKFIRGLMLIFYGSQTHIWFCFTFRHRIRTIRVV